MVRKLFLVAFLAGLITAVAVGWPDVKRYMEISQM